MINKIENFLAARADVLKSISEIIGYDDLKYDSIVDKRNVMWAQGPETIVVGCDEGKSLSMDNGDEYTISNYDGKQYTGMDNGLMYVLAYHVDDSWNQCQIFILDMNNLVK
jgi:hypothetical protein